MNRYKNTQIKARDPPRNYLIYGTRAYERSFLSTPAFQPFAFGRWNPRSVVIGAGKEYEKRSVQQVVDGQLANEQMRIGHLERSRLEGIDSLGVFDVHWLIDSFLYGKTSE